MLYINFDFFHSCILILIRVILSECYMVVYLNHQPVVLEPLLLNLGSRMVDSIFIRIFCLYDKFCKFSDYEFLLMLVCEFWCFWWLIFLDLCLIYILKFQEFFYYFGIFSEFLKSITLSENYGKSWNLYQNILYIYIQYYQVRAKIFYDIASTRRTTIRRRFYWCSTVILLVIGSSSMVTRSCRTCCLKVTSFRSSLT